MFSRGGPKILKNCLFEQNFSSQGWGGGIYLQFTRDLSIDGSVFDGNKVGDFELYGGALYTESSELSIVNSVFTRNSGPAVGGAICNRSGNLHITNCTFAGNQTLYEGGCVENIYNAYSEIVNTILWNDLGIELKGDSFTVSYSCIKGGYPEGDNIITDNPQFKDAVNPKGADSKYGSIDDGLKIKGISPCISSGSEEGYPERDILKYVRGVKNIKCDIGAYEYVNISGELFGRIINGEFVPIGSFPLIVNVLKEENINASIVLGHSRVIQITVPKNEYTDKKDIITATIVGVFGVIQIGSPVEIKFYRIGDTQVFRTIKFEGGRIGKHVLFVSNSDLVGEHTFAYIVQGVVGGKARISVDHGQFYE